VTVKLPVVRAMLKEGETVQMRYVFLLAYIWKAEVMVVAKAGRVSLSSVMLTGKGLLS